MQSQSLPFPQHIIPKVLHVASQLCVQLHGRPGGGPGVGGGMGVGSEGPRSPGGDRWRETAAACRSTAVGASTVLGLAVGGGE